MMRSVAARRTLRLASFWLGLVLVSTFAMVPLRDADADSGSVYIALGDSIPAGIGSSLPRTRAYPVLLAAELRRALNDTVLVENLAVPGETAQTFRTNGQLQAFEEAVARARAAGVHITLVTVSLGGNEMLALRSTGLTDRQQGLDTFSSEYRSALSDIRAIAGSETRLLVTTYYDITGGDAAVPFTDSWWIQQFNDVIRAVASEVAADVVDVAEVFSGNLEQFTHEPYDVHPSNAGHRAIADAIWATLGIDTTAPEVEVMSPTTVARKTPTLRFRVAAADVRSLDVSVDGANFQGPFAIDDGMYAILLDFRDAEMTPAEAVVTIQVMDRAGNLSETDVQVDYHEAVADGAER